MANDLYGGNIHLFLDCFIMELQFPAFYYGGPVAGKYRNPYAEMVSGYSKKNESTMIASLDLEQDLKFITPGLKVKGIISFKNWATTNVVRSFSPYYYGIKDYSKDANGEYTYTYESITKGTTALTTTPSNGGDRLLNYQLSLDYARTFADKHNVGAMLVYLQRDYNQNAPSDFYATFLYATRVLQVVSLMHTTVSICLKRILDTMEVKTLQKESALAFSLQWLWATTSRTKISSAR